MYAATLLADPTCPGLERIVSAAEALTLVVRTKAAASACPACGVTSKRLRGRGFRGSKEIVRYHLSRWRTPLPAHLRYSRGASEPRPLAPPSPRRAAWMLLKAEEEEKTEHRAFAESLCNLCPEVAATAGLAREFTRMVKERCAEALVGWLDVAAGSGMAEFEGFAAGLRRDHGAVVAALTCEWSNGQVEGQINRLKTIKRQMYGRANFDLLRARVLHRALA